MRLILTILLIGLFKADAQMVINASYPYRPYAQPAANLLLDDYPNAAAAYSLRKLDKDYTGAAIRVRKDTTGQPEQDIGFTANGDLDTAALKSFLNARSGFVVTWYNQADSSGVYGVRNATQTVATSQPRIALNGNIQRLNGKVGLYFQNNIALNETSIPLLFLNVKPLFSAFAVHSQENTNTRPIFRIGNTASAGEMIAISTTASNYNVQIRNTTGNNYSVNSTNTYSTFTQYLISATTTPDTLNFYQNSVQGITNSLQTVTMSSGLNRMQIGAWSTSGLFRVGYIQEIVLYNNNQSANRSAIETEINTYYGIY